MKFKILNILITFSILIISGLIIWWNLSWTFIFVPILIWISTVSISSFHIQWNFFLYSINKGNLSGNKIALTFDDGPHTEFTPKVLDLLEKYNAKATFFCIGKNVKNHPDILKKIYENGHSIGNHSFTHSNKIDFSNKYGWLKEIESTDFEIQNIIGKKPRFFRPPFGVTTPHLAKALKISGHINIGWNIRTYDTVSNDIERIVSKVLKKTRLGSIVLMHDSHENIIPLLEQLLVGLERKNYTFVTVNELIDEKPYVEI